MPDVFRQISKQTGVWLLMLWGFSLQAQPGYAGKKTSISLQGFTFPTLARTFLQDEPFRFNGFAEVQAERVLSRLLSLGIGMNLFASRGPYEFDNRVGEYKVQGWAAGVYLRFYSFRRRGNIAPLGPYLMPGIHIHQHDMRDLDQRFYPDGRSDLGKYRALRSSLTLGNQRVWARHFLYQYGLQGSWLYQLFPQKISPEVAYLNDTVTSRLRGFFAFQIFAGLGVIF